MSTHVSSLDLHQIRYGELAPDREVVVRAHVDGCDRCGKRLAAQQAERQAFVLQSLPPLIAAAADAPEPTVRWWRRLTLAAMPMLAAAAALLVFLGSPPEELTRTKGALPVVEVWVQTADGPRALRQDEPLGDGDVIQVLYDPRGAPQVALGGVDGAGSIEFYGAFEPARDGLQPAPFALTLDGSVGPQEVWVLTADFEIRPDDLKRVVHGDVEGVDAMKVTLLKE